jgi:hypothetical protein
MSQLRLCKLILLVSAFFSGCITRHGTMVNFESGETLKVKFTDSMATDGSVEVTMPDGEILKGRYSGIRGTDEISFGSAFANASVTGPGGTAFGTASGFGSQRTVGGEGKAYALLTSAKPGSKLMMEIVAIYGVLDGHGYGEARTNDGRSFKIQF